MYIYICTYTCIFIFVREVWQLCSSVRTDECLDHNVDWLAMAEDEAKAAKRAEIMAKLAEAKAAQEEEAKVAKQAGDERILIQMTKTMKEMYWILKCCDGWFYSWRRLT